MHLESAEIRRVRAFEYLLVLHRILLSVAGGVDITIHLGYDHDGQLAFQNGVT